MFGVDDPAITTAVRAYVKLMRATRAVSTRIEKALAADRLTLTQLGVLEVLLHKGGLSHRALGQKLLTSPGNVTDVVDKLAARGLLVRIRAGGDRRSVLVDLTPQGRALIEGLFPRHAADIAAAMGGLRTSELEKLGAQLRRLGRGALETRGGPT